MKKKKKKWKYLVQILISKFIYHGDTSQFAHFSGCGEIPFQDRCDIFLANIKWRQQYVINSVEWISCQ